MSITPDLGSAGMLTLTGSGGLEKHLNPGLAPIVGFKQHLLDVLEQPLSTAAAGKSITTEFQFSSEPSWTVLDALPVLVSVKAGAQAG